MFAHLLAQFAAGIAKSTTIDLQNNQCNCNTTGGPATATIRWYSAIHPTRAGQVWADGALVNCELGFTGETPVLPISDIALYEVKWNALSGNSPNSTGTSTQNVYVDLADTNFELGWTLASGPDSRLGAVTVTLRRKGTVTPLYTAVWDGEVSLTGTGK